MRLLGEGFRRLTSRDQFVAVLLCVTLFALVRLVRLPSEGLSSLLTLDYLFSLFGIHKVLLESIVSRVLC